MARKKKIEGGLSEEQGATEALGTQSSSSTPRQPEVGAIVDGKYRLIEKLGDGGMGIVYKAEQSAIDRSVAIKLLHRHLVESEEFLNRFHHEARIASKLRHSNAVVIYDFGVWQGQPYIVMELASGTTLRQWIEKKGSLSETQARAIGRQVGSALAEAHSFSIVHRDLKPENIMIVGEQDGLPVVRVLDFGLAKIIQADESKRSVMTQAGMFFGTPAYASPEQALGKELDHRSDIYSLGVILYEAVTGTIPFSSPSGLELLMKHVREPVEPLSKRNPRVNISPELQKAIMRCLEKEAAERFSSATEFVTELESVSKKTQPPTHQPIYALLGAGILLFIAAGILFILRPDTSNVSTVKAPEVEATTGTEKPVTIKPIASVTPTKSNTDIIVSPTAVPERKVEVQPTAVSTPITLAPTNGTLSTVTNNTDSNNNTTAINVQQTPFPTLQPANNNLPLGLDTGNVPQPTISTNPEFEQAYALFKERRFEESATLLEKVVQDTPNDFVAHMTLGHSYRNLARLDDALAQFKIGCQIAPQQGSAPYQRARIEARLRLNSDALSSLKRAIAINPDLREEAKAEPDFRELSKLPSYRALIYPRSGPPRKSLGNALEELGGDIAEGVDSIWRRIRR